MTYEKDGELRTQVLSPQDQQVSIGEQEMANALEKLGVEIVDSAAQLYDIPDSIQHWWRKDAGSGDTVVDLVGGVDGTRNGATWVEDSDLNGGHGMRGSSDGSARVNIGQFQGLGEVDQNFTFATTVTDWTSDENAWIMGYRQDGADENRFAFGTGTGFNGTGNGHIQLTLADVNQNKLTVETDDPYNDGSPHRLHAVKRGNTASDLEIWVDGTDVPQSVINDEAFDETTVQVPNVDVPLLSFNTQGSYGAGFTGVGNDSMWFGADLTSSEIQSDHERQFWS